MTSDSALSRQTYISLGLLFTALAVAVGGARWATTIEHEIKAARQELSSIQASLELGTLDRWTGNDMIDWVERCNREVELWSIQAEQNLGLQLGDWARFQFPMPNPER